MENKRTREMATNLGHEPTAEDEEPGAKEATPTVEPRGPVHDDHVDGREEEDEGQLADSLGEVVGRQVVGPAGSLLVHHHPL